MSAAKFTAAELKLAIKAKFPAPGFQTFFEVANDTGSRSSVYADAVSVGIWPSSGHVVHGFEIKVSRGDWLREIANPGKSQPILKHCDRWWLVCPTGLVEASELPKTWGMLTYSARGADLMEGEAAVGSLRIAVKAPALTPEPITPGFMAAIVRRAGETDQALIAAAVAKAEHLARLRHDERVRQEVASAMSRNHSAGEEMRKLGEKIVATFGTPPEARAWRYFDDASFIAAVRAVMASGVHDSYGGLRAIAEQMQRQINRIDIALSAAKGVDELQTSVAQE